MRIVDRYLIKHFLVATGITLVGLTLFFSFFIFLEKLGDRTNADSILAESIQLVFLGMPDLAYQLLPIATVIGSTIALAILRHTNEAVSIRIAGASRITIVLSFLKGGIVLIVLALLLSEWLNPLCQTIRYTDHLLTEKTGGVWLKDQGRFIHIRRVFAKNEIGDLYFFNTDENGKMRASGYVEHGVFDGTVWRMNNIRKTEFSETQITSSKDPEIIMDLPLNGSIERAFSRIMSRPSWELFSRLRYAKQKHYSHRALERILLQRFTLPFMLFSMILISFVLVRRRWSGNILIPVFFSILAGIASYLLTEIIKHLGTIYLRISLWLDLFPILLFLILCALLVVIHKKQPCD